MIETHGEPVIEDGLTPANVAAYLSTTGWSLVQDGQTLQSWMLGDVPTPDRVLQLPKNPAYADYNFNLRRALRQLEQLHGWDAQQLSTNVLGARSDILYIRADQYSTDGSIPVREAQQLLHGTVEMVTAAARWTLTPRRSFGGRVPEVVKDFVEDDLRMGHTRRGSFVITILTRLDEQSRSDEQSRVGGSDEVVGMARPHAEPEDGYIPPFQRRVMSTLASGLSYVRTAANRALSSTAGAAEIDLEDATKHGVNAQLCQALAEMTDQEGVRALDLSFGWAPSEPRRPQVDRLVFDQPTVPVLRDLQERLAPTPPAERNARVVGYVTRLERGQDAEEGTITVQGFADTQEQRQVRVALEGTSYTTAVQAHDARQLVEVAGRLVREGNSNYLRGRVTFRRVTVTTTEQG